MEKPSYSALFLDRDGVINERLPNAYVRKWEEFRWCPGNPEAVAALRPHFQYCFVVTNQQGVGKGWMEAEELAALHERMLREIEAAGGHIDAIYCCTELAGSPGNCRKPNPSMGYQAKRDFPTVDFSRSLLVGDSLSDLQFGQRLGTLNAWVKGKSEETAQIRQAAQAGAIDIQWAVSQLSDLLPVIRAFKTS